MKNFSFCLLVLLLALPLSFSHAQPKEGTSMKPILTDALTYLQTAEDLGYEIVRMEFDIVTDTKSTYRTLQEGWTYGIIAFGDYRIEQVSVAVYKDVDGTWTQIKTDNESKSNATLTITPSATGQYRVDITAEKFVEGYSAAHYGLIIMHE